MPNFKIHDLYTSMAAAASAQDYLQKQDRNDWTAWDWLCALKDGLTGDAAGARYETHDRIKEELQALVNVKNELPGLTEAQMMARFGSRVRALFNQLYYETTFEDPSVFTEDERELVEGASDEAVLDNEADVLAAEQNARFARFRRDAADYLVRLLQARREEEQHPALGQEEHQALLMSLTAKMYVANNLARNLTNRARRGYPEIFRAEEVDCLAESMLANDENFQTAIRTEVIMHDIPDLGLAAAGQPQTAEALRNAGNYITDRSQAIEELAQTPNQLTHDSGSNRLSPEDASIRLGFLKDVKKELDATGTGYDWRHWFSRPNNSPEYEAVRNEIQRQIDRLEAGLPIAENDRQQMMQVLNAYTRGKEDPNTGFGKTRQHNMLRLYAEYANDQERPAIMYRYNRARDTQDPNNAEHIDLAKEPYRFIHQHQPQTAAAQYNHALSRLQAQFNSTLAAGRPMNEAEQVELRQNVLRLAALREIMTTTRSGEVTSLSEAEILAAMSRIENDPHHPIAGAIAAAGRDVSVFGELTQIYGDEQTENYHLASRYFRDPENYKDPVAGKLQRLSYPTAAQLYRHATSQLAAPQLPQQGGLSQRQIDEMSRLSRKVIALKRIMDRRSPQYHVSTSEQMAAERFVTENTRLGAALDRLNMDAARMNEFRSQILSPTVSSAVLADSADRFANGYIEEAVSEAQDFFRRIQVPAEDPQLNEEDKAVMRDRLVRIAALNNLQNPRIRSARFPEKVFLSDRQFSTEDIEEAMEDVRANEPDFMNAIEQQLGTAGSVKRLASSLASRRYTIALEGIRADTAAFNAAAYNNDEERSRLTESINAHLAELIALHNIRTASESLAMPVSDEALAAEIERVKLSDEYLATERMMRAGIHNAPVLLNAFSHPETLNETLQHMIQTVPVVQPADNTLGADYQSYLNSLATLANPSTAEGRSMVVTQLIRVIACRQLVLENPEGMYAPMDMNRLSSRVVSISTDPVYSEYFKRIRNDVQRATDALTMLAQTDDLYNLKVAQQRTAASGQAFEDPLLSQLRSLSDLRYDEIFTEGMNALMAEMPNYQAGVPLTEEQKQNLLRAAAQMVIGRQAPAGNSQLKLPETDRRRRIQELTAGLTDESRELIRAVDRVAGDGAKVQDLLGAMTVGLGQINDAVRNFARQTPAKWADDAWEKLQAAAKIPHPNGWSAEERRDLVNTYARMATMRELAKDPEKANVPISAGDADQYANNYLSTGNNRAGLEEVFTNPMTAIEVQTLSGRINALWNLAPENQDAATLQQLLALRNLQKKYSDDAIISQAELMQEMAKVTDSIAYKVLSDARNPKVPAIDFQNLNPAYFDNAIEASILNSPVRRAVVLGDAPENSAEGLRRIFAEELRHDRAIGAEAAEIQHFAELYAVSLYASDPAWKDKPLPSAVVISEQAARIAAIPDFKSAMQLLNEVPEFKTSLETALIGGAPASQITAELNKRSQGQRKFENILDVRKSDLHYDVRSAMVQQKLQALRALDARGKWLTEDEAKQASSSLNAKNNGMTKEQARSTYLDFLASNRLYMRNPGRSFFNEAEMAAARQEVEQDPDIQADLEIVLQSPQSMRFNIFNLAPSQYWTEIRAMEEGRDVYLNGPGGDGTRMLGLQTILFSLAPIVEARLNGRDITGRVISNDDLNIERNRVAFTEEYISLENALRHNINELDRIKDVLKLPADQFKAAFDKLTDEYKEKYPEAEIPDKDTLGGDYLRAKEQIAAVRNRDFANDPEARKQLAHGIREIMTIRNIILTSKYDVALKKNTVSESDARDTRGCEAAEEAGKHHITMRLGTPEYLEEKLKDPQVAAQYLQIMDGAEDLRRLYGKKLAAGREIVDPLEKQILDQGLDAPVPSHRERQQTMINQIMTPVEGETRSQRNARLKQQIASLFNLVLHAAGTDPMNMPSDAVLAEQTGKILAVPDFGFAVDRLAKDPQKLTDFINKALSGMNSGQMAAELNKLSYDEQRERNPEAYPIVDIIFRMRVNAMNEANDGLLNISSTGSSKWNSNAHRDEALVSFMTYTAANRLMAQHPDCMYFSERDFQDSFLQAMNDQQLQQEFARTMAGGPVSVRRDLFSYGGGDLLTAIKFIESNSTQLTVVDTDSISREAFREANLRQLGEIGWLHENHLVEKNHLTNKEQTDAAQDAFAETAEFKTLLAASKLDNGEMNRIMVRLLPLSGDAFKQELANVTAEYHAPLDLNYRSDLNRIAVGLHADRLINPGAMDHSKNVRTNVKPFLADTLNIAFLRALPAGAQPNAEEFIAMREELMKLPEFQKAASWLATHPQELKQLSVDLGKGMTPEQIVARFNEAAIKQLKAEDPKAKTEPSVNITYQMQIRTMAAQRSKYWLRCGAKTEWADGDKEAFREEFLDFAAMGALIKAHPKRVWFGREEIRAARRAFEADQDFMAKVEGALESPIVARNKICGFQIDNTWNWINQSTVQMNSIQQMLSNPKVSGEVKMQLMTGVSAALAQAAVTKLRDQVYYEPSTGQMMRLTEDMNASPAFRAMTRALMDDPKLLTKFQNEIYSLEGDAFRTKLEETGRQYLKKYPQAKADSAAMKARYEKERANLAKNKPEQQVKPEVKAQPAPKPEVKVPVQPGKTEVKPPVQAPRTEVKQPKPEIKTEVKQPAENPNRINIIREPENLNVIHEEKLPPAVAAKLKPTTLVMPQKEAKHTALGQYQNSAAQLDKMLALQIASKIPINDPNFVDTAYNGVLQTVAYRNLAEKKEYESQKADKEALSTEVARLKNDKALQPLKEAIQNGYGKTILDGIKHLEDEPEKLDAFLRNMAMDPAGTKLSLAQEFQRPAPKYVTVPSLPKTEVINDVIPKAAEGQKLDINSPAGRYQHELKAYEDALETVRGQGMKGLGAGYNDTIHKSLLTLYSLNQIMAGTKDPTAPVENLNAQIGQKFNELNDNPGSFRHIVNGSKEDRRFRDYVIGVFKNNTSFTQLNEKLQSSAEKVLRHDMKKENDVIERENSRLIREAEKQKDKGLGLPQV